MGKLAFFEIDGHREAAPTPMPWSPHRYPAAMKNLPARARMKAIEIANALLAEGYDEGRAIRIAIARARRWYDARSGASMTSLRRPQ